MTLEILIAAHFFPYPPNHGSGLDIWGQLETLKELGHTVDLISTTSSPPAESSLEAVRPYVRNMWCVQRQRGLTQALLPQPFQITSRSGLAQAAISGRYDLVILQSEYVSPVLRNPGLKYGPVILRLHNDEVAYYFDLAKCSSSARDKIFFFVESMKFRFYSPRMYAKSDQLWFISDFEREQYTRSNPGKAEKALFLPSRVDLSRLQPYNPDGVDILFVGALTRPMNRRGLEWYLEHVHPRLCIGARPRLTIAGYTQGDSIEWLRDLCSPFENTCILPDAEDLEPLYARARVFINPIFAGAGMKLKTIQALRAGLPVVTTDVGVSGTGMQHGEHLLIADSPEEFGNCVKRLLSNPEEGAQLVETAQHYLKAVFDQPSRVRHALERLGGIPASKSH